MWTKALLNSIRWLIMDQRKLIATRCADGVGSFETLLIPDYRLRRKRRHSIYRPRRIFISSNENLVRVIFRTNKECVSAANAYSFLAPYLGNNSIFVLDNASHIIAKKTVTQIIRHDITLDNTDARFLDLRLGEYLSEGEYQLLPLIQMISARIVFTSIFPSSAHLEADNVLRAAIDNIALVNGSTLLFPNLYFKKLGRMATIRSNRLTILKFIRNCLQSNVEGKLYEENVVKFGSRHVADNLFTLFIAGFETTSASIAWGIMELAASPEVQRHLRREILGNVEDVDKFMEYINDTRTALHKYCIEVFRLRPTIPFILRRVEKKFSFETGMKSVVFQRGEYILLSIEEYNKILVNDGSEFLPNRQDELSQSSRILTFGGGPKVCPGRYIAAIEVKLITALLLCRASFRPTGRTSTKPRRNRISTIPKCGAHLSVRVIQ